MHAAVEASDLFFKVLTFDWFFRPPQVSLCALKSPAAIKNWPNLSKTDLSSLYLSLEGVHKRTLSPPQHYQLVF